MGGRAVIRRLREWVRSRSAFRESSGEYNGFLSYAAEWHSLTHGVYVGLTTHPLRTPPEPENRDVDLEPHYYRGGFVIGTLFQALLAVAVAAGLVVAL